MKKAFTLVELLVVVLIIGILTAIAVPMYQSAVDKTHWSTLLPTARALKNAEEAYLMATNVYTANEDALDVAATQGDATYQLQMPDSAARYVIRGSTTKLPNVRLAQYLDENASLAGQLHCEAKTGDERATKLCEKLLNGQELITTDDGYTSYLLDQEVDKSTCDSANRSWSASKAKCYKTTAERCTANGFTYENGSCKTSSNVEGKIVEGAICTGGHGACKNAQFTDQSVCVPHYMHNNGTCNGNKFDNSMCISRTFYGPCGGSTFTNGSVCYAQSDVYALYGCYSARYDETSCCCGGVACPDSRRCSEARCAEVEQQVQNILAQYQ